MLKCAKESAIVITSLPSESWELDCRYIHPQKTSGFSTPELGQLFRQKAFAESKLSIPAKAPPTITLLSAFGGESVSLLSVQ